MNLSLCICIAQVKFGVYFGVRNKYKLIENKGCVIFYWGVKLTPSKRVKEMTMLGKEFKCKIEEKYNDAIKAKAKKIKMSRQKYIELLIENDAKECLIQDFLNK